MCYYIIFYTENGKIASAGEKDHEIFGNKKVIFYARKRNTSIYTIIIYKYIQYGRNVHSKTCVLYIYMAYRNAFAVWHTIFVRYGIFATMEALNDVIAYYLLFHVIF